VVLREMVDISTPITALDFTGVLPATASYLLVTDDETDCDINGSNAKRYGV